MNAQEIFDLYVNETVNENGEVVSSTVDFESFDKLVSALVTLRAEKRKELKEQIRAEKEAKDKSNAEAGKAYYDSLKEGDEFYYKTADGVSVLARKIKTKSNSGSSAACEVISGIEIKTSAKRYPKFHQVVVPVETANIADEIEETADEVVA